MVITDALKNFSMSTSDFICANFDYLDFIHSEEDMNLFKRLQELEPLLRKPVKECLKEVMEFAQIDRKLRGLSAVKFIVQNDPKLN